MPRKSEPYEVIGVRPCGVITDEMLKTETWREHWRNETRIALTAIGAVAVPKEPIKKDVKAV